MILSFEEFIINEHHLDQYDICIIGGGTYGLYAAARLGKLGHRILVLEYGSSIVKSFPKRQDIIFKRREYNGITLGRFYGLGGTSAKWGGQMIPLRSSELHAKNNKYPELCGIQDYYYAVSKQLGLRYFDYSRIKKERQAKLESTNFGKKFILRYSSWMGLRNKNSFRANKNFFRKANNIKIVEGCRVQDIEKFCVENIKTITCKGVSGESVNVSSKYFVLCAGAFETVRFLDNLRSSTSTEDFRYPLCDHISVKIGEIKIKKPWDFNKLFSPFFVGLTLMSQRIELKSVIRDNEKLQAGFFHFGIPTLDRNIISEIKEFLNYWLVSSDQRPKLRTPSLRSIFGLPSLIFQCIFMRRLPLFHQKADLYLDIDQRIDTNNFVAFNNNTIIDWDLNSSDYECIERLKKLFSDAWNSCDDLNSVGTLKLSDSMDLDKIYDTYHPTKMLSVGVDKAKNLLTNDFSSSTFQNLFVLSTAMLNVETGANPGFTMFAISEMIIERLHNELQS